MSLLQVTPQFLFPTSREFLFDEVIEKIVRAISRRNWKIPQLHIEFDSYGAGEAKYQMIRCIRGLDFKIRFGRGQGQLDSHYYNTAACDELWIPKQELHVYDDHSGPTYKLYVGDTWDLDKDWFMDSIKIHSKRDNKPKKYLLYSGDYGRIGAGGRRLIPATWFTSDTDCNREYEPTGNEPRKLLVKKVYEGFVEYLEENVLPHILSFPECDSTPYPIPLPELIPYEGPWPIVHSSFREWDVADRIIQGKSDPSVLKPEDRHANFGSCPRLVRLDVPHRDRYPIIAREGFLWADPNQMLNKKSNPKDFKPWMRVWGDDYKYLVGISIKWANGVYVADDDAWIQMKKQICESIPEDREMLTDDEMGECYAARGNTIVPIAEYKGDYKEPIVLFLREVEFDEIQYVVDVTERDKTNKNEAVA